MLLVQHDKNMPVLYEPWFEDRLSPHQNTSFSTSEEKTITDNIIKYDSSNPKFFKLNGSDYIITASTGNKEAFVYPNDINRERGVTWQWVVLRQLPDFNNVQTNSMANPFGSFFKDNLFLLIPIFLLPGSIMLICVFILKKYFTKRHSILIDFRSLIEKYKSNRATIDDAHTSKDISGTMNHDDKKG